MSCFTCHPNGINHPAGWADPRQHGRLGAMAALNLPNPVAMVSFSHCAKCHGSTFDMAGRVYKNKPAPDNLEVPPYQYISDTRIIIGVDEDNKA